MFDTDYEHNLLKMHAIEPFFAEDPSPGTLELEYFPLQQPTQN